ncbi:hypothetical protein DUI87_14513 [Hirundo rustica rustica]|uniref:Uncharacterized protein n=1 Tax=Hirundo rustica rustica TaxID=333673 RepID=A0A3M0K501_HIRRU|nr:hypothetical protein DUI87_14513 [Hirundo rustica rustica]
MLWEEEEEEEEEDWLPLKPKDVTCWTPRGLTPPGVANAKSDPSKPPPERQKGRDCFQNSLVTTTSVKRWHPENIPSPCVCQAIPQQTDKWDGICCSNIDRQTNISL